MTKILDMKEKINLKKIKYASELLKSGELVIFPTETVYGIGASALDIEASKKIFLAKGRANDNPLIVHVDSFDMIYDLVTEINEIETKLMHAFMPGPFTIILPKKDIIPSTVSAGLSTVGIRMPKNKIARTLIKYSGPIAAPSANISEKPSGTKVDDIIEEFSDKVSLIIDGGESDIGLESTVLKVINGVPTILRPGAITKEDIEKIIGVCEYSKNINEKDLKEIESPGMKYKHYAPNKKCILIYNEDNKKLINIVDKNLTEKTVVIGKTKNKNLINSKFYLSYGETNEEISHNIFSLLRKADKLDCDLIIICGIEKKGLGVAIMNRLMRASSFNYIDK